MFIPSFPGTISSTHLQRLCTILSSMAVEICVHSVTRGLVLPGTGVDRAKRVQRGLGEGHSSSFDSFMESLWSWLSAQGHCHAGTFQ